MKKKIYKIPTPEDKINIIERWRHSKLNSIVTIATEFNYSVHQVNAIINKYLSTKILP